MTHAVALQEAIPEISQLRQNYIFAVIYIFPIRK